MLLILSIIIGVVSVARMARLLVYDDFPPVEWLRVQAAARLPEKWQPLVECQFCLSPYLSAGQFAWAYLLWDTPWFFWGWLVPHGVWAGSYLAAMLVAYDTPEE